MNNKGTKNQNTNDTNHSSYLSITASQKPSFRISRETETDTEHKMKSRKISMH